MNFCKQILKLAKNNNKAIVFPEAAFSDRIIKAVLYLKKHKICEPILVGDESSIIMQCKKLVKFKIINPKTSSITEELAKVLFDSRKHKGLTIEQANELILDPFYFSTMLVKMGYADGMVGGAEVSTAQNLKPALQLLTKKDSFVNTYTIMVGKNKVTTSPFILTDCGLIEEPTLEQLPVMAKRACKQLEMFTNLTPRVAFLSYSTYGSAKSATTEKMRDATNEFKNLCPSIQSQGEIQIDAALLERVAKVKLVNKNAEYYGKANVLIFPDLNSANICYKAISYFGKLYAIGPITVGLDKPVNDLSRGCSVKDIIYLTAITVLQSKNKE